MLALSEPRLLQRWSAAINADSAFQRAKHSSIEAKCDRRNLSVPLDCMKSHDCHEKGMTDVVPHAVNQSSDCIKHIKSLVPRTCHTIPGLCSHHQQASQTSRLQQDT